MIIRVSALLLLLHRDILARDTAIGDILIFLCAQIQTKVKAALIEKEFTEQTDWQTCYL